jgi:hypothetical protein
VLRLLSTGPPKVRIEPGADAIFGPGVIVVTTADFGKKSEFVPVERLSSGGSECAANCVIPNLVAERIGEWLR